MHTNVSEAKEKMSRTLVKTITKKLWEEAEHRLGMNHLDDDVKNKEKEESGNQNKRKRDTNHHEENDENKKKKKKTTISKPLTPAQEAAAAKRAEAQRVKDQRKAEQINKKTILTKNPESLIVDARRAQKRKDKADKLKAEESQRNPTQDDCNTNNDSDINKTEDQQNQQQQPVKKEKEVLRDANGKARSKEWTKQRQSYPADKFTDRQIITPQPRIIQFRLYLKPEMRNILRQRIEVYYDLIQHAREVVHHSLQQNQVWDTTALEERIILTEPKWNKMDQNTQTTLLDRERRQPYRVLQHEVQQEAIKEVMAAFKSCQTNLQRGNTAGFQFMKQKQTDLEAALDQKLDRKSQRFLWMKFTNRMLQVDPNDGSVHLHYRTIGLPNPKTTTNFDAGLYLRDRLITRPDKSVRVRGNEWTKQVTNHLLRCIFHSKSNDYSGVIS